MSKILNSGDETINQSINQSKHKQISKSIDQSINQSNERSINQQSINQSIERSMGVLYCNLSSEKMAGRLSDLDISHILWLERQKHSNRTKSRQSLHETLRLITPDQLQVRLIRPPVRTGRFRQMLHRFHSGDFVAKYPLGKRQPWNQNIQRQSRPINRHYDGFFRHWTSPLNEQTHKEILARFLAASGRQFALITFPGDFLHFFRGHGGPCGVPECGEEEPMDHYVGIPTNRWRHMCVLQKRNQSINQSRGQMHP